MLKKLNNSTEITKQAISASFVFQQLFLYDSNKCVGLLSSSYEGMIAYMKHLRAGESHEFFLSSRKRFP